MKTHRFLAALLLLGIAFTSCDNSNDEVDPSGTTNYWLSNSLVRMQLKGNVKSVAEISMNSVTTLFDQRGMITERQTQYNTTHYTYNSAGQLVSMGGTTYEYGSHGKYIPESPFHWYESGGLVHNLKAVIYNDYRTDVKVEGDKVLLINTRGSVIDTTVFNYSGNYPTGRTSEWDFIENVTYASNGMFSTYSEGFYGANYRDTRKYTFKADNEYLLPDKREMVGIQGGVTNNQSITTYTYNDKKDPLQIKEVHTNQQGTVSEYIKEYFDYVYDPTGNWTSRKRHIKNNNGQWEYEQIETRTITYW